LFFSFFFFFSRSGEWFGRVWEWLGVVGSDGEAEGWRWGQGGIIEDAKTWDTVDQVRDEISALPWDCEVVWTSSGTNLDGLAGKGKVSPEWSEEGRAVHSARPKRLEDLER
jgi:hypothetical protein